MWENTVVKANKSLGFVRRNLYPCSESTKRSAYVTIEPKFGVCYCCVGSTQTSSPAACSQIYQTITERKAHRLNIFYLAVNNSIALPIPDYFFT